MNSAILPTIMGENWTLLLWIVVSKLLYRRTALLWVLLLAVVMEASSSWSRVLLRARGP